MTFPILKLNLNFQREFTFSGAIIMLIDTWKDE
jgi:hypothetical protein